MSQCGNCVAVARLLIRHNHTSCSFMCCIISRLWQLFCSMSFCGIKKSDRKRFKTCVLIENFAFVAESVNENEYSDQVKNNRWNYGLVTPLYCSVHSLSVENTVVSCRCGAIKTNLFDGNPPDITAICSWMFDWFFYHFSVAIRWLVWSQELKALLSAVCPAK